MQQSSLLFLAFCTRSCSASRSTSKIHIFSTRDERHRTSPCIEVAAVRCLLHIFSKRHIACSASFCQAVTSSPAFEIRMESSSAGSSRAESQPCIVRRVTHTARAFAAVEQHVIVIRDSSGGKGERIIRDSESGIEHFASVRLLLSAWD